LGAAEVGPLQLGLAQVGALEVGTDQVGILEGAAGAAAAIEQAHHLGWIGGPGRGTSQGAQPQQASQGQGPWAGDGRLRQ
jgi:hypothetical protein